jgi:hypothetical protein
MRHRLGRPRGQVRLASAFPVPRSRATWGLPGAILRVLPQFFRDPCGLVKANMSEFSISYCANRTGVARVALVPVYAGHKRRSFVLVPLQRCRGWIDFPSRVAR